MTVWNELDLDDDDRFRQAWTGDPGAMVDAVGDLLALLRPPAWHAGAACAGQGTAAFFQDDNRLPARARAICRDCPVRTPCLATAMADPLTQGVWAGTTTGERRK